MDNLSSTKLLLEDSDPEIKSLAQDELNIITEQLNKNEIEIKKLLIPEMKMMKKMFLKLEREQAGTKQVYLLEIYLECLLGLPRERNGK